jgi:hypothetical protein
MTDSAQRRPGLEPIPGRVPPLPSAASRAASPGVMMDVAAPSGRGAPERRPGRIRYRALESQVDSEVRDFLQTTAFTIRLRTESSFDRSALLRGILRAVLRSGVDLTHCESEEEVTSTLARFLPPGAG